MPNDPTPAVSANTTDLAVTEYDAGYRAQAAERSRLEVEAAVSTNDEPPEVGLSQKGEGEDAVVKRETEI